MAVIKGSEYIVSVPARNTENDLVETTAGLTVKIKKDNGVFTETTNSPTPIIGYGFQVVLTDTEMTAETVTVMGVEPGLYIPVVSLSTESSIELSPEQIAILSESLAAVVGDNVANSVVDNMVQRMKFYDSIRMGQGTGSVRYEDSLSDGRNPIRNASVRAFPYIDEDTIDWDTMKARHVTDGNGGYVLFLDPGKYEISVEKNGIQVNTMTTTIVAPL